MTGINPHTIRAWEKRYQCLTPDRDSNGRRLYCDDDINKLKLLQDLINYGNNISKIAKLDIQELEKIHLKYLGYNNRSKNSRAKINSIDLNTSLQRLLLALNSYRLDIICHELEKLTSSIPPRELALSLLAPLLRELGENVSGQNLSIAQEHALSALLRFHVGQIISQYISESSKISAKTYIITTPEGERHEFGIMIAALLCCQYGIKFYYLGVDLPQEALSDACKQFKADGIILGISKVMIEQKQNDLRTYLKNLSNSLDGKIHLILGGLASNIFDKGQAQNIDFVPTLQLLDMKLANI